MSIIFQEFCKIYEEAKAKDLLENPDEKAEDDYDLDEQWVVNWISKAREDLIRLSTLPAPKVFRVIIWEDKRYEIYKDAPNGSIYANREAAEAHAAYLREKNLDVAVWEVQPAARF